MGAEMVGEHGKPDLADADELCLIGEWMNTNFPTDEDSDGDRILAAAAYIKSVRSTPGEHGKPARQQFPADLEPKWPSDIHRRPGEIQECNYTAARTPDDSGLFCNKCGFVWSATSARLKLALDRIDTLTAEVAPWRELKSAMNRNELAHEDAYYAVERAAREEGKQ